MWDDFLDRTATQSCNNLNRPATSHKHTKTDIHSVESLFYIPKEILSDLVMKDKPKTTAKPPRKHCVPVPIYYRIDGQFAERKERVVSAPACRRIKSCRCDPKSERLGHADKLCRTLEKLIPGSPQLVENTLNSLSQKLEQQKEIEAVPAKKVVLPPPILKLANRALIGERQECKELAEGKDVLRLRKPCDANVCGRKWPPKPRKRGNFWRTVWYGEAGSGTRTSTGEVQDFYKLRDENLANNTLFEDPEFPAEDISLFTTQRPDRYYEWKRPHEISNDPKFFVEGFSRFDVQQGELGDCWLLAAAANLTLHKRLFFQIIPDDQEFDDKYAGIFHFRFWQYGKWIDIVIDDRLPTYRGQLVYLHSTDDNEFWSALLEKAYAKLNGSYEALKGGSTCEAMEDFTGGVTEMYEMDSSPPNLFQIMVKAHERSSLMGCSIEPDPHVLEAQTAEGLVRGHAYSITKVQYIDIQTPNVAGKIPLIRMRNPWGNETEWNGAWSDGAPEWRFISEQQKEELGLTFDDDGEFWMSFKDFMKQFSRLEICNLNPDSLSEEELREGHKKKWEMSVFEGEWVRGVTAGGCRNYLDSFWRNPQYRITLTEVDEDDEDNQCTMIVALMQKNRRILKSSSGVDLLTVGFAIYHLTHPDRLPKPLDLNFFRYNASVARSPSFINLREVSCRFKLPPGTYCIVPSTFDPNEEGEFLLRVFTEKQNIMEENEEEVGYGEVEESVKTEPTEEEKLESDRVYQFFLKLAGEDKEIDWMELQQILNFSLKTEFQQKKIISEQPKKMKKGVNAAPVRPDDDNSDNSNCFTSVISVLCGSILKDIAPHQTESVPLKTTLNELTGNGFSKDICRSMVSMLDKDRSGKLGYVEFKQLWGVIRQWKNVWSMYDQDKSGTFSGFEFRDALTSAGYKVNSKILNILMHRFGNRAGQLEFDDFVMCSIKLKTMIDIFKEKDTGGKNTASFSFEEWLETTLYS